MKYEYLPSLRLCEDEASTSACDPYDLYGDQALEDQSVARYACEAPLALGKERSV